MKIYRTLISIALFISIGISCFAQNQKEKRLTPKELRSQNEQLLNQNDALRAALDSLCILIEELEAEAKIQEDLVKDEIIETIGPAGLRPEEYTPEITDSLLAVWYNDRTFVNDFSGEEDMDSVVFTSNVPDSVLIQRLTKINSYITLPFNATVKNYMVLYSEKMVEKMGEILGLSSYYFPMFEEIFDKYDLPLELKYMAVIESALNATARSRAGARGMWQFMYSTAKIYGLKINSFVDERLDVAKACDAAARYLQDSYNIFGDWSLAISSYNCGSGNVNKAIRRSGGSRDFWSIYPYLPRETRGYVPAFVGAMYAMNYAKEYGLYPAAIDMPAHTDTFEIKQNLHFKQISEMINIPIETLRELNPQYVRDIIPGNEDTYILRLPHTHTNAFIDVQDTVYAHKADSLMSPSIMKSIESGGDGQSIRYVVKSGDYLGRIANRYRVSVANLKRWNNLRSNNIRVGQVLYIYNGSGPAATSSSTTKAAAPAVTTVDADGYVVYTVRSGDSLYTIAKGYPGVSANDIMSFNNLTSSRIKPGMKLRIPKKK